MNLRSLIHDYLKEAKLMQVATTKNDRPWACSVYFAFDEDFNLYWISKPNRRHSQEIRNNSKVAGTVVLPHTPGDKVRGIQFEGIAHEVSDEDELRSAMAHYASRFRMDKKRVAAIIDKTDGHLCYKTEPSLYVLFDEVNYPKQPRQEWKVTKP